MKTAIKKEHFNDQPIYVLYELNRENINEPWIAIDDSENREEMEVLKRYYDGIES